MIPAQLAKPLANGAAQCRLCSHFCRVGPGEAGLCGVRVNRDGTLYTLVGDVVAAVNLDPIEKKPLFHFLPGTMSYSMGAPGCNMECSFCQNWSLSQPPRQGRGVQGRRATPDQLVDAALGSGAASISYTYSEPTVFFELMRACAEKAVPKGLKNVMVSNGYMSRFCLDELGPLIHAANIDLKAMTEEFYRDRCGASLKPVLENLARIRALGWWLEVTTLVIPGLNDSDQELTDIARFIRHDLGPEAPWHVSRFHPDHRLTDRGPTPVATLERAWDIGRAEGLHYVYIGNVHGHPGEHTLCPACGQVAVQRQGYRMPNRPTGSCPHCGAALHGVGWPEADA